MLKTFLRLAGGLLLVAFAGIGGLLMWSWAPDVPLEKLKGRWAAPPSQFLAFDGMDVHVRDEGPRDDPVPLLLLHGTSSSLHTFDGWTQRLSPSRRVIRLDLPGFGLTGPRPDGDYSGDRYRAFLVALLDRLQVRRVIVAGNSFGGGLAWQLAVAEPARVAGLILIDAGGYAVRPTSVPVGFRIAQSPPFNRLFEYVLPRSLIESSLRNVYGDPTKVTPDTIDLYFDMAVREGNRLALVSRMSGMGSGMPAPHIADIRQPTLILWGGRDRLIPPESAERFHADISGSRLVVFPTLGHVPQEEDPLQTLAPVETFLREYFPR